MNPWYTQAVVIKSIPLMYDHSLCCVHMYLFYKRFDKGYLHLTNKSIVAVAGLPTSLFATQVYRPASLGFSAWNLKRDLSYKNGISPSCECTNTGSAENMPRVFLYILLAMVENLSFTLFLQDIIGIGTPFDTHAISTSSPKFTSSFPDSGTGCTVGGSARRNNSQS